MTEVDVISLIREALFIAIKISAPILITALIVGLILGIIQTTTSIQEPTIAFVPRLIAILLSLLFLHPGWCEQ